MPPVTFTPPRRRQSLLAIWGPLILVLALVAFLWIRGGITGGSPAGDGPHGAAALPGASATTPDDTGNPTPTQPATGPAADPATPARSSAAATPKPTRTGRTTGATPRRTPDSGLPTVPESALPREAHRTLARIHAGGPFPYRQDDQTFGNRERLLPARPGGYYREYTVETPGEDDRGPRRIIAGAGGDLYWTSDHYASFRQILEGQ